MLRSRGHVLKPRPSPLKNPNPVIIKKRWHHFSKKKDSVDVSDEKLNVTAAESSNGTGNVIAELEKEPKLEKKCVAISEQWKNVFKKPQPAPLCGHNELSIIRTVKKPGVNFNRQFYVCARGEGHADDPEARCNFFKWKSQK